MLEPEVEEGGVGAGEFDGAGGVVGVGEVCEVDCAFAQGVSDRMAIASTAQETPVLQLDFTQFTLTRLSGRI
jgi:hypothetical protein